jgi:hypothetical protein
MLTKIQWPNSSNDQSINTNTWLAKTGDIRPIIGKNKEIYPTYPTHQSAEPQKGKQHKNPYIANPQLAKQKAQTENHQFLNTMHSRNIIN